MSWHTRTATGQYVQPTTCRACGLGPVVIVRQFWQEGDFSYMHDVPLCRACDTLIPMWQMVDSVELSQAQGALPTWQG